VYSHLVACHVSPDVLSCVSVLDALMEAQRYDEALQFYAQARKDGVRPDIKGYTQVLRLVALAERCVYFRLVIWLLCVSQRRAVKVSSTGAISRIL
jgi:pentatricopeptide repeat protein